MDLLKEMHEILMGKRWCVSSSSVETVNPIISASHPSNQITAWSIIRLSVVKTAWNSKWIMSRIVTLTVVIFMKWVTGLATRHELFNYRLCFCFWCQIKCLHEKSSPLPPQVFIFKKKKSHLRIYRLKIPSSTVHRDKEIYLWLYFSDSPFFNKFSLFPGVCSGEAGFVWDVNDYHRWGKEL